MVALDVWKLVEGRLVHACLWVDPGFQQRHASYVRKRWNGLSMPPIQHTPRPCPKSPERVWRDAFVGRPV